MTGMAEGAQARKLAVECEGDDDVRLTVYTALDGGCGSDGVGGDGGIALSNGDWAGEAVGEDGYDVAESGWRLVVDLDGGGSRVAELAPWFPLWWRAALASLKALVRESISRRHAASSFACLCWDCSPWR